MKIRHPSFKGGNFHKKGFLFVHIKSMQVGDDSYLKHVGILMKLFKSKLLSRVLKFGFSADKLKSPNKSKFSYEELNKFNEFYFIYEKQFIL